MYPNPQLFDYYSKERFLSDLQQAKKEICIEDIDENIPDLQNIEVDTEDKAAQQKLMALIKTLDEKYADILILKFFYDLPDKEIARTLGISLENAKIRLHREKNMLRAYPTIVRTHLACIFSVILHQNFLTYAMYAGKQSLLRNFDTI